MLSFCGELSGHSESHGRTPRHPARFDRTAARLLAWGGSSPARQADVLAGVGHDLTTAIDAGRHARDIGVRMLMVHQPVGPYISAAGWLEYHRVIAGALPDMGIVLYLRDMRIGARHIR